MVKELKLIFEGVTKNVIAWGVLIGALLLTPMVHKVGLIYGPLLDGPAVEKIEVEAAECDTDDLIITLFMQKESGHYRDLKFYASEDVFSSLNRAWRELAWRDLSGYRENRDEDRSTGAFIIGPLRVNRGCEKALIIETRHRSELGWWQIRSQFGVFGPFK